MKTVNLFIENYIRGKVLILVSRFVPVMAFLLITTLMPSYSSFLTFLPLYIIAILLVVYKPEIIIIAIITFTSTVFALDAFPQVISLGEVGLYLPEALLILLWCRTLVIAAVKRDFQKMSSPLTVPMLLLCGWIIISILNAIVSQRATIIKAILAGRGYLYYTNFFLVLYYLDTKEKVNLVAKGLLIIAVMCALLSFVQYIFGPDSKILPLSYWGVFRVIYEKGESSLARVMPTSISLIYMLFFPVLLSLINLGVNNKGWYKIIILLFLLAIFVTFSRNVYYSIMIGLSIIWFKYRWQIKYKLLKNSIALMLIVLLCAYLPVYLGIIRVSNWWEQVFSRHVEFITAGAQTETLAWRAIETGAILAGIAKSPLLGNGIGASYYHPLYNRNESIAHNGYLSLIFQIGVIGLLIFLLISFKYLLFSIKVYKEEKDQDYQAILLGLLVGFIALLPAVWVKPVFVQEFYWISLMGFIWAVPQVFHRIKSHR